MVKHIFSILLTFYYSVPNPIDRIFFILNKHRANISNTLVNIIIIFTLKLFTKRLKAKYDYYFEFREIWQHNYIYKLVFLLHNPRSHWTAFTLMLYKMR